MTVETLAGAPGARTFPLWPLCCNIPCHHRSTAALPTHTAREALSLLPWPAAIRIPAWCVLCQTGHQRLLAQT